MTRRAQAYRPVRRSDELLALVMLARSPSTSLTTTPEARTLLERLTPLDWLRVTKVSGDLI